jgi:hypothetical protein
MTDDLGETRSGEPITEDLLEQLTAQAEKGFDVEEILRRRVGPPRDRRLQRWSRCISTQSSARRFRIELNSRAVRNRFDLRSAPGLLQAS